MINMLVSIYENIAVPVGGDTTKPFYAIVPIPDYNKCFIGKDSDLHACLLISTADNAERPLPPIRLENLDVQFGLPCHLKKGDGARINDCMTVIRCRSKDQEVIRYFLSVCSAILRMLGEYPSQKTVESVVRKLIELFKIMQRPPTRAVNGLFGELYLISRSVDPIKTLISWRVDDTARFDFSTGRVRIEVKVTGDRTRIHTFSFEQCNPPANTTAVVASMFVERSPSGITLQSLMNSISLAVATDADLVFKLHNVVAATLGTNLKDAMSVSFDEELTASSLSFFDLSQIPAIRGMLPAGVSGVHFRSDLSALEGVLPKELIELDSSFSDLLPRPD